MGSIYELGSVCFESGSFIMGFTFQGSDFSEFLAAADKPHNDWSQPDQETPNLTRLLTPKGEITYEEYSVKDNLSILQGNYQLNDDITIYGKGDSYLLELHFNLSEGHIYYHNNAIKREIAPAMSGNITFLSPEENKAKIAFNKDISYHTFDVHLPLSLLANYSGESNTMDTFLNNTRKNLSATLSKEEVKVNPKIYSTIQAIKNCTFDGLTKKIFLESKIYELIAFVHEGSESSDQGYRLTTADEEKIKYAALLIRENLNSPFTIMELARQLGINQTKLKSGFKAVFGTTVFGYLQETRMHMAHKLLLDTSLTIQQISSMSGYKSISNFSTAFKQTYSYPPNRLRSKVLY